MIGRTICTILNILVSIRFKVPICAMVKTWYKGYGMVMHPILGTLLVGKICASGLMTMTPTDGLI
jgi:hypothetical protein